jgi:hypothetical protein
MNIKVHEVERVFSPWQWRVGLAEKVLEVLRTPIASPHWCAMETRFIEAIADRAEMLHATSHETLQAVANANLSHVAYPSITVDAYGEPIPGAVEVWARQLRTRLDDLVTEDLLGPDLCPRHRAARPKRPLAAVERNVALELDYFQASGRLTAHEHRIVTALRAAASGDICDWHEAAEQLQMSYGALKRALQRIRAKTA